MVWTVTHNDDFVRIRWRREVLNGMKTEGKKLFPIMQCKTNTQTHGRTLTSNLSGTKYALITSSKVFSETGAQLLNSILIYPNSGQLWQPACDSVRIIVPLIPTWFSAPGMGKEATVNVSLTGDSPNRSTRFLKKSLMK